MISKECSPQVISMLPSLNMSLGMRQAIVGMSFSFNCVGINLSMSDIVWLYYPTGNSSFTNIIYSDDDYITESNTKYQVQGSISGNKIVTTLRIRKVSLEDALYTYQCACNVYRTACATGAKLSGEANLIAITTSNFFKCFFF